MRLFLWLAAALVAVLNANSVSRSKFTLPGGLPNGSIITFFFWHVPNANVDDPREPVGIDFYDQPTVYDIDEDPDRAHLRFDLKGEYTEHKVFGNTYINHQFRKENAFLSPTLPPSEGWWRIDMYKHDSYTLHLLFQGAWSDYCTFEKSLDNVKSIYINSEFVDFDRIEMRLITPNSNIPLMSVAEMKKFSPMIFGKRIPDRSLISFPYFPVGTHIEMASVIWGNPIGIDVKPTLMFEGSSFIFMTIFQLWERFDQTGSSGIWISNRVLSGTSLSTISIDELYKTESTVCSSNEMNGELQHLYLKRITLNKLELRVFYKSGAEGVKCTHTVPNRYISQLDRPFTIKGENGAMILHLDHSIPRAV